MREYNMRFWASKLNAETLEQVIDFYKNGSDSSPFILISIYSQTRCKRKKASVGVDPALMMSGRQQKTWTKWAKKLKNKHRIHVITGGGGRRTLDMSGESRKCMIHRERERERERGGGRGEGYLPGCHVRDSRAPSRRCQLEFQLGQCG